MKTGGSKGVCSSEIGATARSIRAHGSSPSLSFQLAAHRARSMRRPVEFRDRVEVVDPCLLRANEYLPAWHQFISLAQRSKPHIVGFLLIANRCRIERRAAVRAETLQTDVAAIGRLAIFGR